MAKPKSNTSRSKSPSVIGRRDELVHLKAGLSAGKNMLLEGPVGAGKTHLALAVIESMRKPAFRVDGDSRYTEQKLTGWFDPPTVMKKGFRKEAFLPGPLTEAMLSGGILFINELNRLPEGVQNVLLPAIDEKMIAVPRLGEIRAKEGFQVIATQNPKEFVATSHLSEAILDRFEWISIGYQSEAEEREIVMGKLSTKDARRDLIVRAAVHLVRSTREHARIRRGASVRAAISIAELSLALLTEGYSMEKAWTQAVIMALPTRIEIERDAESERSHQEEVLALLTQLADSAMSAAKSGDSEKKKT